MRVAVITLSLVTGLVMHDFAVIPMRLSILIGSEQRPHEAVVNVALFALWVVATALVYAYPRAACCLFAVVGGLGLYDGLVYRIDEFTLWGSIAIGFAALTSLAGREKQLADQIAWTRAQHELAVHAALRSLQEAVPELLSRSPIADDGYPRPSGLVELRPEPQAFREAARR